MRTYLSEFWEHKDLTLSFAVRDIKARYKQTALGAAWAVLQPFSLMVVFTLVFSRFAQVPSDGVPYPDLFVLGSHLLDLLRDRGVSGHRRDRGE